MAHPRRVLQWRGDSAICPSVGGHMKILVGGRLPREMPVLTAETTSSCLRQPHPLHFKTRAGAKVRRLDLFCVHIVHCSTLYTHLSTERRVSAVEANSVSFVCTFGGALRAACKALYGTSGDAALHATCYMCMAVRGAKQKEHEPAQVATATCSYMYM